MGFVSADKTVTERIGLLVGWFVLLALYVVTGVWYLRRRTIPYLHTRDPINTTFIVVCVWGTQSMVQIGDLLAPPVFCHPGSWVLYPLSMWCLFGIFALAINRCLSLICKFESQRLRLSLKLREEGFAMPLDNNIFQRNLPFLNSWWPAILLFAYSAAIPLAKFIARPPESVLCKTDTSDPAVTGAEAVLVIMLLVFALKVRTVNESLGIVSELAGQGVCGLFHLLFLVTRTVFFTGNSNVLFHVEVMIMEVGLWWVTYGGPLRMSYIVERQQALAQMQQQQHTTSIKSLAIPPQLATFSGLLASKPGRASFRQHLQTEFSVENLFFVDDVEAFRTWYETTKATLPAPAVVAAGGDDVHEIDPSIHAFTADARTRAFALYQRYIAAAAPFEINLSSNNKKELHAQFRVKPSSRGRKGAAPRPLAGSRQHSSSGAAPRQQYLTAPAVSVEMNDHKSAAASGGFFGRSIFTPDSPARATPGLLPTAAVAAGGAASESSGVGAGGAESKSGAVLHGTPIIASVAVGGNGRPQPAAQTPSFTPATGTGAVPPARVVLTIEPPLAPIDDENNDAAFYVHLFDAAHAEVYHLLVTDSYVRYVHSSLFEKLVQQQTLANELAETPKPVLSATATATGDTHLGTVSGALSRGSAGIHSVASGGGAGGVSRTVAVSPNHRRTLTANAKPTPLSLVATTQTTMTTPLATGTPKNATVASTGAGADPPLPPNHVPE